MEHAKTAPWRALTAALSSLALALALAPVAAWADDAQSLPTSTTSSYTTSGGKAYTGVYVLGSSSATTTYEAGTLSAGTYVLDGDVDVTGTLTVSGGSTSTCEVTIDLNGHTISYVGSSTTKPTILATQYSGTVDTTAGSTEGYYGCTLTITDTSDGGIGMVTGSNSSGGVVNCVSDSANGTSDDDARVYLNLQGGTIGRNDSGYGIYISRYCTFTMTDGAVAGNANTGVYNYTAPAALSIIGGTISGNGDASTSKGGGVYVYTSSTFTMSGGTITGNNANCGGGVYVDGNSSGSFTMSGGTISGNTATKYSGGVYCSKNSFTMSDGSITSNTAGTFAGGVEAYNCTASISGGKISDNAAGSYAGGVYVYYKSTLAMSDGTISGNTAVTYGGGVVAKGSSVSADFSGGTISGNEAGSNGGGVYVEASGSAISATLSGTQITGNTAGTYGGGAYVTGYTNSKGTTVYAATLTATGGTLANNTASTAGADIATAGISESLSLSGVNSSVTYEGDGKNQTIDGWYDDSESARYEATSSKTAVTSFASGTAYYLIAAYSNTCVYGEPTWTWTLGDDGTYTATATFTCTVCTGDDAHTQTVTASEVTDNGDGTYTAEVSFCGDLFSDTIEVDFLGGSLRYSVSSEDASSYADAAGNTDLRLGFTYQLPVDSSGNVTATGDVTIYYAVGTDESAVAAVSSYSDSSVYKGTAKREYGTKDYSDGYATYLSNVVVSGIGASHYADEVYARVWVVYEDSDGATVELESATVHRSVGDVCEGILSTCSSKSTDAEKAYATALCAAYYDKKNEALYDGAPTSTDES